MDNLFYVRLATFPGLRYRTIACTSFGPCITIAASPATISCASGWTCISHEFHSRQPTETIYKFWLSRGSPAVSATAKGDLDLLVAIERNSGNASAGRFRFHSFKSSDRLDACWDSWQHSECKLAAVHDSSSWSYDALSSEWRSGR